MDDERNDIAVGHVEPVIDHDWSERTAPDDIGPDLKRLGLDFLGYMRGVGNFNLFWIDRAVSVFDQPHPIIIGGHSDVVFFVPLRDFVEVSLCKHFAE